MALIFCKECDQQISKKAKKCPGCGAPNRQSTSAFTWICTIALGVYGWSMTSSDRAEPVAAAATIYPVSNASYQEVNRAVGCKSNYSDDKKEDVFSAEYKNRWMTWSGKVVLAEANNASLNVDNFGTQDVRVEFRDSQGGYHLVKGERVTVKFLMNRNGGCIIPFSGTNAIVL